MDEYPFNILDIAAILRLTVRRELADSVYVDCPFCQKRRGKMNLNFQKNVWRCNRCGESGNMFQLYAKMRNISVSEAKMELVDELCQGAEVPPLAIPQSVASRERGPAAEQAELAPPEEIDKTMRALLGMLTLAQAHREHLHEVRGLTDEQIEYLGLRSTASYKLCYYIPQKLKAMGCVIEGVPGFYLSKKGRWAVNLGSHTVGILIPVQGVDGLIHGAQIRLDAPIRDDDDPDDGGTRYIWFSSSGKEKGASPGSPVGFIGDPHSRVVYVTEGRLKAGIAHCLMRRSFLSIQGANNLRGLKEALEQLRLNGTEEVIEAHDMDKFSNPAVASGASKIYLLARQCGLKCRSLTWNPNYKGIDDWQLALRRKAQKAKDEVNMDFKELFLSGRCEFGQIQSYVERWHEAAGSETSLADYLGLTQEEYTAYCKSDKALRDLLESQRRSMGFRVYQVDFSDGKTRAFAFQGIKALYQAGYQQPPAADYCLVHEGRLFTPTEQTDNAILERIFMEYNDDLPANYHGRSVSPSDVIELFDEAGRRYYYCDSVGFVKVRFSPMLTRSALERPEQAGGAGG